MPAAWSDQKLIRVGYSTAVTGWEAMFVIRATNMAAKPAATADRHSMIHLAFRVLEHEPTPVAVVQGLLICGS